MDTSIIIIGLILLVIMSVPLYFVFKAGKINKKQITSLFAQHNQNNRYQFQLVATSPNRKALAIDAQNRGLLFIDLNLKEPYTVFRDLAQVQSCGIAIDNPQGKTNTLKKVEWIFMSNSGKTQGEDILFHDANKNYIVPVYGHEELKLAEEWQNIINKHL